MEISDERLREIADDEVSALSTPYPHIQEMARELLGRRKADRWIPVKNKPPEGQKFLVLRRKVAPTIQSALYRDGRFLFAGEALSSVTHWRPLPAPPEVSNG